MKKIKILLEIDMSDGEPDNFLYEVRSDGTGTVETLLAMAFAAHPDFLDLVRIALLGYDHVPGIKEQAQKMVEAGDTTTLRGKLASNAKN